MNLFYNHAILIKQCMHVGNGRVGTDWTLQKLTGASPLKLTSHLPLPVAAVAMPVVSSNGNGTVMTPSTPPKSTNYP